MKKLIPLVLVSLVVSCQAQSSPSVSALTTTQSIQANAIKSNPQAFGLPPLHLIPAPSDNPLTQEKIELGFRLWFEPALSGNNKMTCATCHDHRKGFSNGSRFAQGITGAMGDRNVPTIYDAAHQHDTFWDGRAKSLEDQALGPIQNPVEMNETLENVIRKLKTKPYYTTKFKEVFQSSPTPDGIAKALASFERAIVVKASPFERYRAGDKQALNPSEIRGFRLFMSRSTDCFNCHRGPALSDHKYYNIGVGMNRPNPDLGRYNITKDPLDRGAFKIPSLKNIAKTGPYMHDGSLQTLEEVVEHYNKGGIKNPALDWAIRPLNLTVQNKSDLVAFLKSLSAPDNLRELGRLPGIRLPKSKIKALTE